ncbi:MAG: PASTA domain-containing protein [Candidatus Hydrogenedentes bacterium]|jgi:hypothetical protein|nr:PASTA domain-containing protein [Candidatus Hydrogenedentota bacterium]
MPTRCNNNKHACFILIFIAAVTFMGWGLILNEASASETASFALVYAADDHGSISGASAQYIDAGGSGSPVTAIPDDGYHFTGWSDGSIDNPRRDTDVTASETFTAYFDINSYTLSYSAGGGGRIFGEVTQHVNHNKDGVEVNAVANEGFHFDAWSDGVKDNPRADKGVTENIDVTAHFVVNTYVLSYHAGTGGSLLGKTTQIINHGGNSAPVAAEANTGHLFVLWDDGNTDNPRQDKNVKTALSVTALFALKSNNDAEDDELNGGDDGEEGEEEGEEIGGDEDGEAEGGEEEGEEEGEEVPAEGEEGVTAGFTVPNVVLQNLETAQKQIEAAGLSLGTVSYKCSDTIPEDAIIKQSPGAGTILTEPGPVSLIVSDGDCPTACDSFDLRDWGNVLLSILVITGMLLAIVFGVESLS